MFAIVNTSLRKKDKKKSQRRRGSVLIPKCITEEEQADTDSIRVPMIMHGDNPVLRPLEWIQVPRGSQISGILLEVKGKLGQA